ncbi:putative endonuclease related to Holliday junction resolvase [Desulfosporosinus acidiphilus SJ4]|uniref:Putative endonuclease related to Holliday junction resolvase n=1 Tax=Desulfosporosinus acidiphilus (strain DSM 22704 / JCM 16185 / SJ4) TaxID=646529 RepID=I4D399_DESAJ|nr:restriction endonuclease [Desulfosporosinus acidiphilus]AFM40273.1 putative endonuclease related to Holliday junction resolvase [Desulfosporosinus acidiphilus SJ4]
MPRYSYRKFNATRKRYGVRFNSKQGHQFLIILAILVIGYFINHPYLFLGIGSLVLFIYFYEKWSVRQAIRKSGIEQIDLMGGTDFEKRLQVLFNDLGYRAKLTPKNDFGADVIVEKYNGGRTVVQAKRYSRPVGLKAVQEVIGAMAYYDAINAIVITNQNFTQQAERLALKNKVELWDRQKLIYMINSALKNKVLPARLKPS